VKKVSIIGGTEKRIRLPYGPDGDDDPTSYCSRLPGTSHNLGRTQATSTVRPTEYMGDIFFRPNDSLKLGYILTKVSTMWY
jgi:hypothetical protein